MIPKSNVQILPTTPASQPTPPVKYIDPSDQTIVRKTWNPSAAQYAAYKEREVSLCVYALGHGLASAEDHMLFSEGTVWQALALLSPVKP